MDRLIKVYLARTVTYILLFNCNNPDFDEFWWLFLVNVPVLYMLVFANRPVSANMIGEVKSVS